MASYRSFRGSKGTLGPCRAVCLWRVGLESCWGSAVSHACQPPVPPCFWRFRRRVWAPVCRHNWPRLGLESCFLRFRFSSPPVWKCFQPSVRELFVPILWLPRRCVFDGFLQEFEGFKGYVRPLSGRLSLAGWAGILLGLCRFACVPTTGTSMLLAVSKACLGPCLPPQLATPWAGILLSALSLFESSRLKVFPAVRTGAFRADFVASKKVRFRWLPTGVWGVQRVR